MIRRVASALVFAAVVPATFLVLVPALLLDATGGAGEGGALRLAGLVPIVVGIAVLVWCFAGFVVEGEGTPAPYDPPRRLVTGRLYAWVRNPMYLATTTILLGEAIFYASVALLAWTAFAWAVWHLFVVLYEEPALRRAFGRGYEAYLERVPRWIPLRPAPEIPPAPLPARTLATLVYALRDGEVLLHRRVKEPNIGLWVAPGGKLDPGESPVECAIRELREETGLETETPLLRGVMTEVSPRADYQWLTFIFAATRLGGTFAPAANIGEFRWMPVPQVYDLPIPPTDAIFFARVVRLDDPPFLLKFTYDDQLRIVKMEEA